MNKISNPDLRYWNGHDLLQREKFPKNLFFSSVIFFSSPNLIFPGYGGRASVKVKTQNDSSLHATLRNDRRGPRIPFFFFCGGEREKKSKWSTQVSKVSFPPISARAWRSVDNMIVTSAERGVKDSCSSGMLQSCIRRSRSCFTMSRSCFGISSRYLRVLWFILSGERNNYEEEIIITSGRNKEK